MNMPANTGMDAPVSGSPEVGRGQRFLVLSAHDYRSARKANIHFITEQLSRRGPTRFFSLRYSRLSRFTGDPRVALDARANRVETHEGVDCYLWKTLIHPFNSRRRLLRFGEELLFRWYVATASPVLRQWLAEADVILFESGVAPVFFDLARRLNRRARTIYIASDDLETINVADYVKQTFQRVAPAMSAIRLASPELADAIPSSGNLWFVPHGIDHGLLDRDNVSPYGAGTHVVSVGSMLFDAEFFVMASRRFPDIQFHIIGCGQPRHPDYGPNVVLHGEMPHAETVRYIRHADVGVAPYRSGDVPRYLADTSMKLIQYDFLGVPAVCPHRVVGDYSTRFGYHPGNEDAIASALNQALAAPRQSCRRHLSWAEVADRVLAPERFDDTGVSP